MPVAQLNRANAVAGTSHPLAGVVAPALTGMLYVALGITGIVLIDMATFVIAVLVLLGMRSARAEPAASSGPAPQFWRELRHGYGYLRTRPALLTLVIYSACANFFLNGSLGLSLPYLLTLCGDEQVTGIVMAFESLGGLIGGALLAAYAPSIRSRVKLLNVGMLVVSAMLLLFGSLRAPFALALVIFVLIAALQVWSLLTTILQLHTPSELHGRVLSIAQQLGYLGATSSFLLSGPLVDRVLEPAVGGPGWAAFAWLLGDRPGAGMGLLFVLAGVGLLILTVGVFARPAMRGLDTAYPKPELAAV